MRKRALLFRFSVCLAILAMTPVRCTRHSTPALGRIREVTVVSDWWGTAETPVRRILQQKVPTPQPESEFMLRVFTTDRFDAYHMFRTVFVVGTAADSIVRQMLGARADSLPLADFGLFQIPNAWADNQQVVVFVARDANLLGSGLELYADRLRKTFREIVLGHSARVVYRQGQNQQVSAELLERYAFQFDVPRGWFVNQEHGDGGFVYLYGHHPDRSVFVHWVDSERQLEPARLLALRDSLTARYYEGDLVLDSLTTSDTVEFLARPALRIAGVWQNEEDVIGGPFVSYGFNYLGRFFLLDGTVYNPGRDKLDGVFQVEAVLRTFTPQ